LLILTRKIGEAVIIGANVRVVVLEVRGKQVRLGIEAPMDVVVVREEISQHLAQENLQAAGFLPTDLQTLQQVAGRRITAAGIPPEAPREVPRLVVNSPKLGAIQVPEDQVITFAHGLSGFNGCRRFVLVDGPEVLPFLFLQSVDHPEVCLVVADPSGLVGEFRCHHVKATLKELQVQSLQDLQVFVVLTIPPQRPKAATANLVSPILINPTLRLGKQVVLEDSQYSYQHRLLPD
jgi:flagellar assembly factor FliW